MSIEQTLTADELAGLSDLEWTTLRDAWMGVNGLRYDTDAITRWEKNDGAITRRIRNFFDSASAS